MRKDINLAKYISKVWLLGNGMVLIWATMARKTLRSWGGGVLGWLGESTVFGFCGFEWDVLLRLRSALNDRHLL